MKISFYFLLTLTMLLSISQSTVSKQLYLKNPKGKNWSLQESFIKQLVDIFEPSIFLETGTLIGETAYQASLHCKEVHTIELDKKLYNRACKRFKHTPSVHVHHGDSAKILPELLPSLHKRTLFWLDGHYSGDETALGDSLTPILQELDAIKAAGKKDSIILIDDIRLFGAATKTSHKPNSEYPTIHELYRAVKNITDESFNFIIYGDIAFAYPDSILTDISPVIRACTASRLFDGSLEQLQETMYLEESIIASAQGDEKEYVQNLALIFQQAQGQCKEFALWRGLILAHDQNYYDACKSYLNCISLGETHWRVYWYLAQAANQAGNGLLCEWALDYVLSQAQGFDGAQELYSIRAAAKKLHRISFNKKFE